MAQLKNHFAALREPEADARMHPAARLAYYEAIMLAWLRITHERLMLRGFVAVSALAVLEALVLSPHAPRLDAAAITLAGLPVAFASCFLVVGLQLINPACPPGLFRLICGFFFVFSLLATVIGVLGFPFVAGDRMNSPGNVMATAGVGTAWATHALWKRGDRRRRPEPAP